MLSSRAFPADRENGRFARLYQRTQGRLHRLAAGLLGPGPRAEDAVHDTFVKLMRHYDHLAPRSDEDLERWLTVAVRNTALDMLRRDGRETELDTRTWEPAVPPDLGAGMDTTLVESGGLRFEMLDAIFDGQIAMLDLRMTVLDLALTEKLRAYGPQFQDLDLMHENIEDSEYVLSWGSASTERTTGGATTGPPPGTWPSA